MEFGINKSKIEKRMRSKMDGELINLIVKLKKSNPIVAKELARPKRRWPAINLKEIDMVKGDVLIAGKVLSAGELSEPKRIVAWSFSEKALKKIKETKGSAVLIVDEVKKNAELNGLEILG
jgi:ribosomal protein L18E